MNWLISRMDALSNNIVNAMKIPLNATLGANDTLDAAN
jgi:hypothetical protein